MIYFNVKKRNHIFSSLHIASFKEEIKTLIDPEVIVIPENNIKIEFTYPLKDVFYFEFKSKGGFTRQKIVELISKKYEEIYDKESNTSQKEVIPLRNREVLLNRNTTDGDYGIWGHDLEDLYLEGVELVKENEDNILKLHIGS